MTISCGTVKGLKEIKLTWAKVRDLVVVASLDSSAFRRLALKNLQELAELLELRIANGHGVRPTMPFHLEIDSFSRGNIGENSFFSFYFCE